MTEPPLPVRPVVVPVTHAGITPRAVPMRKGCDVLMPHAVKTYVSPGSKWLGRLGLKV